MVGFLQLKKNNKFLNTFVYSNTLISLGAFLLCLQTYLLNNLNVNLYYCIFVFTSTFVSYNIQRLFRAKEIQKYNPNSWFISRKKVVWTFVILNLLISIFSLYFFISLPLLIWLIPVGVISFLYSFNGLRNIPYLKIFFISISWGITCGVIPFVLSSETNFSLIFINFSLVFLYIFSITIPFDIRDKSLDEDNKKTIPQIIGIEKAKKIANITLLIYLLLSVYFFPIYTLPFLLSCISAFALIRFSFEKNQDLYFSFWIDGHILFQFFVIFLIFFSNLF